MAAHPSILAQRILWTEEPGGLQSMGRKESDTTEHKHMRRLLSRTSIVCVVNSISYFMC